MPCRRRFSSRLSGSVPPGTNLIDSEEDLYSVFRARAELMGWSTTSTHRRPLLWSMEEAELTNGTDESRIGFVQIGLPESVVEPGKAPSAHAPVEPVPATQVPGWAALPGHRRSDVDPAMALPTLIQCFDDALRRFGVVELSGLQVTCYNAHFGAKSRSFGSHLVSGLNWFNTTQKARADALIAFDQELLGGHTEAELVASLQRWNTGSFEFGPVVAVPEQHSIKVPVYNDPSISLHPAHSGLGVSVTLPEWTASAAAWVLGSVIDAARDLAPDVGYFAVRMTQVR